MSFATDRQILVRLPQYPLARLILILVSFGLIALALLDILGPKYTDNIWSQTVSICLLVWIIAFSAFLLATHKSLYCFGLAYVIALVLFHLGSIVAIAVGILRPDDVAIELSEQGIRLASWYTIYALGAFGIGYAVGLRIERRVIPVQTVRATLDLEFFYGFGLLLASCVFLALAIQALGNLLNYSRLDLFQTKDDVRGFGAMLMVFPSSLIALVIGANRPTQRLIAYSIGFIGFALLVLSGYRTSALYPVMIGAILWVKTGRRIPNVLAIGMIVAVMIAIPIIGTLRQTGPYGALNQQQLSEAADQSDWRAGLVSMGQTNGILGAMLDLVPRRDPYRYGESYITAVIQAFPNIGMKHAESPRELINRLKTEPGGDPARRLPLNDWLTYRIAPDQFFMGAGTGSSAIGEAYVNFGVAGVFFVFVLFGFGLSRLDGLNLRHRPWLLLTISVGMFHFCRTVRDDISNFTKPFVFCLIIILLWTLVLKAMRRTGILARWVPQVRSTPHPQ
ncbi:O-antigen polysaccharide polymerase Wzy [Dongia soli]|uniref:O-antigen polysaccharide polymerase Wzy n=1 Tax=Dongia soli TaxID=600628 RepID=A0ABU5E8W3_9PROT|nr:O-antigen polysaccharide polymerase Wzy [Dongia soli]MDY0882763.1 O-antigen polysaccharide polymerase Wzy [Dongia soli]